MSKAKFFTGISIIALEVLAILGYLISISKVNWNIVAYIILGLGIFLVNVLALVLILSKDGDSR